MTDIINRLLNVKKNGTVSQKQIAITLLGYYDRKKIPTTGREICEDAYSSLAGLTKFIKLIDFPNLKSFLYEFKNSITNEISLVIENEYEQSTEAIIGARKIFFIGVGASHLINLDFANKLSRLDLWTSVPNNKYDQVGQAKLLTNKDVLVATSASMQHIWMKEIIENTKARVIVNSFLHLKSKESYIFINKKNTIKTSSAARLTSTQHTTYLQNNFFDIWNEIISNPRNQQLLKLTKY